MLTAQVQIEAGIRPGEGSRGPAPRVAGCADGLDSALSFEKPKKRLLRVFGLRCGFVYWLDEASPARGHPGLWSLCAEVAPKAIWARPSGDKHSPPPEMSQHAPHDMANGASRCHCRF